MSAVVTLGGVTLAVTEPIRVSNGLEEIASAEFTVPGISADLTLATSGTQAVVVELGYGSTRDTVFTGVSRSRDLRYFPWTDTVKADGNLSKTERELSTRRTYKTKDGGDQWYAADIVTDLLEAAGLTVNPLHIGGVSPLLCQDKELTVPAGEGGLRTIRRIDAATASVTVDWPDGTVRRIPWPVATSSAGFYAHTFVQGVPGGGAFPILEPVGRQQSLDGIYSRVKVLGHQYDQPHPTYRTRPHAGLLASASVLPSPRTLPFAEDLLETTAQCQLLASDLLKRHNRLSGDVTLVTLGLPDIVPGEIVLVTCTKIGADTPTPFVVTHYDHEHTAGHFLTTLRLGGPTAAFSNVVVDLRPTVAFTASKGLTTTATSTSSDADTGATADMLDHYWYLTTSPTELNGMGETEFSAALRDEELVGLKVRLRITDSDGIAVEGEL